MSSSSTGHIGRWADEISHSEIFTKCDWWFCVLGTTVGAIGPLAVLTTFNVPKEYQTPIRRSSGTSIAEIAASACRFGNSTTPPTSLLTSIGPYFFTALRLPGLLAGFALGFPSFISDCGLRGVLNAARKAASARRRASSSLYCSSLSLI